MSEITKKYELLAVLPLTGTEDELKALASKVEERIKAHGGTVVSSHGLQKGKLPYSVKHVRQAYHHLIQFEMLPVSLGEFQRALLLAGETLRFNVIKIEGTFRPFVASPVKGTALRARPVLTRMPAGASATASTAPPARPRIPTPILSEGSKKGEEKPVISMEELDRKLEEILGK